MRPFVLTEENILQVRKFTKDMPWTVWGGIDDENFLRRLAAPMAVLIDLDGEGLLIVEIVRPRWDANIELLLWDRRLLGKEEPVREALGFLFHTFGLKRLQAPIPTQNTAMQRFLHRMGFSTEARLRSVLAGYRDCFILGMLEGELNNARMAADTEGSTVRVPGRGTDTVSNGSSESGSDTAGDRLVSTVPAEVLSADSTESP